MNSATNSEIRFNKTNKNIFEGKSFVSKRFPNYSAKEKENLKKMNDMSIYALFLHRLPRNKFQQEPRRHHKIFWQVWYMIFAWELLKSPQYNHICRKKHPSLAKSNSWSSATFETNFPMLFLVVHGIRFLSLHEIKIYPKPGMIYCSSMSFITDGKHNEKDVKKASYDTLKNFLMLWCIHRMLIAIISLTGKSSVSLVLINRRQSAMYSW